jgi:sarcosine oxidase
MRRTVAVVGAGVMGAATARHLAEDGHAVTLLERAAVGHAGGSSHGTSRIFRLAYPDPALVELAREAFTDWARLESAAGTRLLLRTGTLVFGPVVEADAAALTAAAAPFERLSGRDAGRRWPVATAPDEAVLYQPDGAVILADLAHRALVDAALAAGTVLVEEASVATIEPGARSVRLGVGGSTLEVDAVVLTAGAWTAELLASVGIELGVTVTRETVAHYRLDGATELPAVIDDTRPGAAGGIDPRPEQITYALASPGIGLKVALHDSGPVADPDRTAAPEHAVERWTSTWVRGRFPQVHPSPDAVETCLYTTTPDARFVLERHGRIVVGSACSGHGFKFAPAVGRRLAALAVAAAS